MAFPFSSSNLYYSIAELITGLRNAIEGDTLVLVDGHYSFNGTLLIKTNGITLTAHSPGGVIFTHGYVGIRIKASGITLSGIQVCHVSNTLYNRPRSVSVVAKRK